MRWKKKVKKKNKGKKKGEKPQTPNSFSSQALALSVIWLVGWFSPLLFHAKGKQKTEPAWDWQTVRAVAAALRHSQVPRTLHWSVLGVAHGPKICFITRWLILSGKSLEALSLELNKWEIPESSRPSGLMEARLRRRILTDSISHPCSQKTGIYTYIAAPCWRRFGNLFEMASEKTEDVAQWPTACLACMRPSG